MRSIHDKTVAISEKFFRRRLTMLDEDPKESIITVAFHPCLLDQPEELAALMKEIVAFATPFSVQFCFRFPAKAASEVSPTVDTPFAMT